MLLNFVIVFCIVKVFFTLETVWKWNKISIGNSTWKRWVRSLDNSLPAHKWYYWTKTVISGLWKLIEGIQWIESLSRIWLFATPWLVAHQASLSMGLSRQEYWSQLPFPYPEDLSDPGIEPVSSELQVDSLQSEPPGKPSRKATETQLKTVRVYTVSAQGCSHFPLPLMLPRSWGNPWELVSSLPDEDDLICNGAWEKNKLERALSKVIEISIANDQRRLEFEILTETCNTWVEHQEM